ncbi:MAG: hypothetical protein Fur0018_21370 [Anaerolineales bacterium]
MLKRIFAQTLLVMLAGSLIATLFTILTSQSLFESETLVMPYAFPTSQDMTGVTAQPAAARTHVGIVAGHWGNDSGAVCSDGLTEVDLNLQVATLVQQRLAAQPDISVDLLQEFDPKLNGYKAQALVSIHADSCTYVNDLATGYKVAPSLASMQPERADRLTACLRSRYAAATRLNYHNSITPDMSSYHAFNEISPETPAAIIEIGFMNLDRNFLTQHTDAVAQGIADGLLCYLYNENIPAP